MNLSLPEALKLKYSTTEINAMLPKIAEGGAEAQPGHTHRLVTADAFSDAGREAEARLLRSGLPIYTYQGRVYHAKAAHQPERVKAFLRGYTLAGLRSAQEVKDDDNPQSEYSFSRLDVHPNTLQEMKADALHFLHSMYPHSLSNHAIQSEVMGETLWRARNRKEEFGTENNPPPPIAGWGKMAKVIQKMGPYSLELNKEVGASHKLVGVSKPSKWGQPEGLPE